MKRISLLFVLAFLTMGASYAVDDNSEVRIVNVIQGDIQTELEKMGLSGKPYFQVTESDLPTGDRDFWKIANNKVEIDQVKKQAHEQKMAEKQAKKNAVLGKLKITEADWKELNDKDLPTAINP